MDGVFWYHFYVLKWKHSAQILSIEFYLSSDPVRALAAQQQRKRNKLKFKKKKSFYTWETIVAVVGVVHMGTWKGNLCNFYKGLLHSECICQAHIDVITFLGRRHSPTPHWQTVILDRAKSPPPPLFFPFLPHLSQQKAADPRWTLSASPH